jgi:hypothetical protein
MDKGQVEVAGRNWLIPELLKADLEVAIPARDRGIDIICYAERHGGRRFIARPIQIKAARNQSFAVDRKYETIPDLLLAYVWRVSKPEETVCYCLTYPEAESVAKKLGWTKTDSWKRSGNYTTQNPSQELVELLEPVRMGPSKWWRRVSTTSRRALGHARGAADETAAKSVKR